MNETIPVETIGIIHSPFKELENMPSSLSELRAPRAGWWLMRGSRKG